MLKAKSKNKSQPIQLLTKGDFVSTPVGMASAVGLGLGALSLLLQMLNYGAVSQLSHKEMPLVQLSNGDTIPVKALEPKDRSPEAIKKFVSDSMVKMFNWDGLSTSKDTEGQTVTVPDKGIDIRGEKTSARVTTKAWEAAFTLSENQEFRASFLKKLSEITPQGIFNGNAQVSLVPRYVSEPRKIGEGKWEIDFVGTLVTFSREDNAGSGVAFNKTITVVAISSPQVPPENTTELAKQIYAVRRSGMEIVEIVDLNLGKKPSN